MKFAKVGEVMERKRKGEEKFNLVGNGVGENRKAATDYSDFRSFWDKKAVFVPKQSDFRDPALRAYSIFTIW